MSTGAHRWSEVALSARGVSRRGGRRADAPLRSISLDVLAGQLTVLMGPTGSGKSQLLRVRAGTEAAEGGTVDSRGGAGTALVQRPLRGSLRHGLRRILRSERGGALTAPARRYDTVEDALAADPELVLADEVGAGHWSSDEVERLARLRGWVDEGEGSALIVSADPVAAARADRILFMVDGTIVGDLEHPDVAEILTTISSLSGR